MGKGSVVKAGSVLTRNVPAGVFWGDDGGRVLAEVTVPLTRDTEYPEFVKGLRPVSVETSTDREGDHRTTEQEPQNTQNTRKNNKGTKGNHQ